MNEDIKGVEPYLKPKAKLSKIWLLPILAVLIGIGMVYHNYQNRGIYIQVTFETAEGLVAGKTQIKYRNVDIGVVKKIGFKSDHSSIIVDIEIQKSMRGLLLNDSQFWVVRPRVGVGGISGIGTLLSGAYLELSPGTSSTFSKEFVGLELPPITSPSTDGLHLELVSKDGQHLNVGNPVLYRGFQVGKVESFEFDTESREVSYSIFVNSPYDDLISSNTYFWNVSGMSVNAGAKGLSVDIASIDALIAGGVQFDIPDDLELGERIVGTRAFTLYDSLESVENRREYKYFEYAILVSDSVGGLYKGAPVEYRGIRIGTVEQPFVNFDQRVDGVDPENNDPRIPVIIRIEPGRIYTEKADLDQFKEVIEQGVKNGLVATIESASFITGALKVSLNFAGQPTDTHEMFGSYPVIPSKSGGFASITDKLDSVLANIEALPLEKTIGGANRAIGSADNALVSLDQSLKELQTTLKGLQPNSQMYESLESTMTELQVTMKNVQPLLKELSNKPSSIIFSGAYAPDDEPKAKGK
jgi:paraquat-inducible protein B